MKTEVDDVDSIRNAQYEIIIRNSGMMARFLDESSDFEKILMYKYIMESARKIDNASPEENNTAIQFYWLASKELGNNEGVKKYLHGEISLETVEEYAQRKREILEDPEKREQDLLKRIIHEEEIRVKEENDPSIEEIVSQVELRRQQRRKFTYTLKKVFKPYGLGTIRNK